MKPLHFNSASQPLYGVYHAPAGKHERSSSVLLCPPIGHEHMQSYWAFKQLAIRLSRLGFAVLRFDYFGTGNSAGRTVDGNISIWETNIHSAARELQRLSGVDTLIMAGLRMGAFLAARGSRALQPEALILWDPIISGKQYLEALDQLHQAKLNHMHRRQDDDIAKFKGLDRLGYLYGEQLLTELAALSLEEEPLLNTGNLTVLSDNNSSTQKQWLEQLNVKGIPHKQLALEDNIEWENLHSMEASILPSKTINTICNLLQGRSQ